MLDESGTILILSYKENGKKWFKKHSMRWRNIRYGGWYLRVLCLAGEWKKWAFKNKCNNAYHVQLAPCGYSQVQRFNFTKNHLSVVNNITFCILLLIVIHFGFSAKIVNIETLFLYGDPKEEIFTEHP